MKKYFLVVGIAALFSACGPSEKDQLQAKVDSLNTELHNSQQLAQQLNEVGALMDSIDVNRKALWGMAKDRLEIKETYISRMKGLKNYVKNTEDKIAQLEKTLKKSNIKNSIFSKMIDALKSEVQIKVQEITLLSEQINKFKEDNENLTKVNETQGLEIQDKQQQIETKIQQVAALEQKVDEVSTKAKEAIATGYMAQAKSVEQIAKKTKLAPKKKKQTIEQSLELYRKALLYGNEQAKAEIDRLEDGLKK